MEASNDISSVVIPLVLGLTILLLLSLVLKSRSKKKSLPPGPWGIPGIGYLPFLGKSPEAKFMEMQKKYGNIFCFHLGQVLTVVLNDFKTIEAAFIKSNLFSNRPVPNVAMIMPDDSGMVSSNGEVWKIHKRFGMKFFHDHVVGRSGELKALVKMLYFMEEIQYFLSRLSALSNDPNELTSLLVFTSANISALDLFGKRFNQSDEIFVRHFKSIHELPTHVAISSIQVIFPWIRYIPFIKTWISSAKTIAIKESCNDFYIREIKRIKAGDIDGGSSNYVEAYLTESKRLLQKTGNHGSFTERRLLDQLLELTAGALDTTNATMTWMFAYLINNPDIQKKVQAEIDEMIGQERLPSIDDRKQMIYTEAVIMETLRMCCVFPFALPHSNEEACELSGYYIPKNSYIVPNIWAVHHDSNLWDEPYSFKPDRFLKDGKIVKPDYYIPFSIGKRSCLGEQVSKEQIFLLTTSIFQKFTITSATNKPVSLERNAGVIRSPKAVAIRAIRRTN